MKSPYPHQEKAVDAVFDYFKRSGGNPVVSCPVGGGKSLIAAEIIGRARVKYPSTRFLVLCHIKELLEQDANELHGQYPDIKKTFYCAGLGQKDLTGDVIFASVQSLAGNVFKIQHRIDLVIIDEVHLVSHKENTSYQNIIKDLKVANPKVKIIGLTGTPFRADTGSLTEGEGAIFTDIVYQIPMLYLIEKGFLCPLITPKVKTKMDTTGVATRNGDYVESQLQAAVNKDPITKACVDELIEYGANRNKWLIFTAGIEHCEKVRDEIRSRGISCEMLTGKTPKDERAEIYRRYKNDEFKCLVNVAIATTGVNIPAIDLIAFMRPTRSKVLYIQCGGRGMRIHPSKRDCVVLDFGGVVDTLGPIDVIDAQFANRGKTGEGEPPTKICPNCQAVCFASTRECQDCAFIFPPPELKIKKTAATDVPILSSQIKEEEEAVLSTLYSRHMKQGKTTPVMKVTHFTFNGHYKEWICFEHNGFARDKAVKWHKQRLPDVEIPATVDEALKLKYPQPESIVVRKIGKYPEIVRCKFKAPEPIPVADINTALDDTIPF